MSAPPTNAEVINRDALGITILPHVFSNMLYTRLSVISQIDTHENNADGQFTEESEDESDDHEHPARSYILTPVFDSYEDDAKIVAAYMLRVPWEEYFLDLLPEGREGFQVVLNDSCGTSVTFALDGPEATQVGYGDLHEGYDDLGIGWVYLDSFRTMIPATTFDPSTKEPNECVYTLFVYPTDTFRDLYTSDDPLHYAIAVSLIFVFTAIVFLAYDWTVARRQNKVLRTATRTQAIVASLFPENVQERILQEAESGKDQNVTRFRTNRTKYQLQNFLNVAEDEPVDSGKMSLKSRPIADLFPEATVIFAE